VVRPSSPSNLNSKGMWEVRRREQGHRLVCCQQGHAQSKYDCSTGSWWAAKGSQDKVEWEQQGTSWRRWKGDAGEWRLGCCCHCIWVNAINVNQLEKGRKGGLLWRVRVWSMGGAVGREKINFTVAKSRGFLYQKAREATEIVIRRCELFPSVVKEAPLIIWEGSKYRWQWEFIYFMSNKNGKGGQKGQ